MGEEGEEEVGKKKRRSARILELEGEKKKKIKDKKEAKEQGEGSTNKLKVKSKSEVEEGPKQDHEEHEEEQEKNEEEQNPSTREAVEAPTVNEETLEDVDIAFAASPSQQVSLLFFIYTLFFWLLLSVLHTHTFLNSSHGFEKTGCACSLSIEHSKKNYCSVARCC